MHIPAPLRPLIGIGEGVPNHTVDFLGQQGYLVDCSDSARQCSVFLDMARLNGLRNHLEIVKYIEASDSPLLRFGRWPDGAASAISITGDLDALTLQDLRRPALDALGGLPIPPGESPIMKTLGD